MMKKIITFFTTKGEHKPKTDFATFIRHSTDAEKIKTFRHVTEQANRDQLELVQRNSR